jgi:hypothetical protein
MSSHILSSSLLAIVQSFHPVYSELLTALLNKLQLNEINKIAYFSVIILIGIFLVCGMLG